MDRLHSELNDSDAATDRLDSTRLVSSRLVSSLSPRPPRRYERARRRHQEGVEAGLRREMNLEALQVITVVCRT